MNDSASLNKSLAADIIRQVAALLLEAEAETKPLEIDPYRSRLFELFVTAEGAGYLEEDAQPSLEADVLCRELSTSWGLTDAARSSVEQDQNLSPESLSKMRLLWSIMRMWMEWDYAWQRWGEFHQSRKES